jgi:UDP-2-acetamido-2,6-beta-L-arabino-hexul-4-ose reductase
MFQTNRIGMVNSTETSTHRKTIGITGGTGLLGWHLRAFLRSDANLRVIPVTRASFATAEELDALVSECDVLVHLAGMNRGNDDEVEATNVALAEALVSACVRTESAPHVIYSNSIHCTQDNGYGRSKRRAAEKLERWAERAGAVFTDVVLPHVFGECGKPFYNSVVSTFCHQLANGLQPVIHKDGELELLHAQQVARKILEIASEGKGGTVRVRGVPMTVTELLSKLTLLAKQYQGDVISDIRESISLDLFNTYRSYLFPVHYPVTVKVHSDERGSLFEAVKTIHGGQCFISSTRPGVTRGNHYHTRKFERFLVVQGTAKIRVRKVFDKAIAEFEVRGDSPQFVDMPTLHTHNITNTGDSELITLFWAHEIFDPAHTDTVPEPV